MIITDNKQVLQHLVNNNGNCVNLGRTMLANNKILHTWVIEETSWMQNNVSFNERVYCILNNINTPVMSAWDKPAIFVNLFKGYSLRHATKKRNDAFVQKQSTRTPRVPYVKPTSLEAFVKRNRIKNKHLYEDGMVENVDYISCPLCNERLIMLSELHLKKCHGIDNEILEQSHPNYPRSCEARLNRISVSLKVIDEETGLTKHEKAMTKAKESLSTPDEFGVTGYQKLGNKTRETHMNNIDEHGRNGYSRIAVKAIIKGNDTKAKKGLILPPEKRSLFYRYKLIVTYLTERLRKGLSVGYITGLAGEKDAWHIDHNYSIMQGYVNKVSPLVIGHKNNLRMIPWEDNLTKHSSAEISIEALLESVGYTMERSVFEFEKAMEFILEDKANGISVSGARIVEKLYETAFRE